MTRLRLTLTAWLVFLSFSSLAETGPGMGYNERPPEPICTHEPESSVGLVERLNHGRTGAEALLGNEQACLERNGLIKNGQLVPSAKTVASDLNHFYDQCTFVQSDQLFTDMANITEFMHLQNRDKLINGLFQDVANRSSSQLNCRIRTFDLYKDNASSRQSLNAKASARFNSVLERVRGLILSKRRIDSRNRQDVFNRIDCSGLAWFFCNDVVKEKNKIDLSRHEMAIAAEISKIPFGYEPDVAAAFVAMAERGGFDEGQFATAIEKTRARYFTLNKYYTDRMGDDKFYCIDREFKEKAVSSGVIEKLLKTYPESTMNRDQKIVLQCKLNSKYKVTEENFDTAANATFMVAGAATAVLTAVPSGGGSLAAFAAVTSAGLSAASFAYQVQKAHEACVKKDFVLSPDGTEQCNPEEDFNKEVNQYSLSDCLQESGFALLEAIPIPLDIQAVVKARREIRIVDLVNDAAISQEINSIRRTGNVVEGALDVDGNSVIVVTGKKLKRYFDADEATRIERALNVKGIKYTDDIPDNVFRNLSPEEKVYIVENLGQGGLSPDKGKKLKKFFESHPDGNLSATERTELETILRMDLKAEDFSIASKLLEDLEEKGYVRSPASPAAPARLPANVPADSGAIRVAEVVPPVPRQSLARTNQIRSEVLGLSDSALRERGIVLSGKKDQMLDELIGANPSREDVEIAIDVISGGPHKNAYRAGTRGSDIPIERYEEIERRILSNPNYASYRDELEELVEVRIRQGQKLADEEWDELRRTHPAVREGDPIDCNSLAAIYPGSFPPNGKCRRVEFDEEVKGRYCYCGGMGNVGFNWLTKCPSSAAQFRSMTSYVDDFALPHASSPEMCTRVSIPKGKQCYLGPTGATLSGFGGASQVLCINRPFSSRTIEAATAAKLQGAGEELAVRAEGWSPFSTFPEFQGIIQTVVEGCTNVCDVSIMRTLDARYAEAKRALQTRGLSPAEAQRLREEISRMDIYLNELKTGGRRIHSYKSAEEAANVPLSTPDLNARTRP